MLKAPKNTEKAFWEVAFAHHFFPAASLDLECSLLGEVSLQTIEGESIGKSVHTAKNTLVKVKRRGESSSTSRCIFSSKQPHFEGSLKH